MQDYIGHLYNEDIDGYIHIMQLESGSTVKVLNTHYEGIKHIVEDLSGQNDVYISPNTFYIPKRLTSNIRHFRALYLDIDLEHSTYSKYEAVYETYMLADKGEIPKPTMAVDSGRGIHLYWRIENAPMGALWTWQELEDFLYSKLKYIGADIKATDGARVLRLPTTINSRNNSTCKVLDISDNKYSMYDLRKEYLNYKDYTKSDKRPMSKGRKVINIFNSYSLHMARLEDIETLCRLRDYDVRGHRNMMLHCFVYWKGICIRDDETLKQATHELNNKFKEPMKDPEVRAILKSVPRAIEKFIDYEQGIRSNQAKRVSKGMRDKGGYWYKNETLIDRLDITEQEQQQLKTIIGTTEKYRRNNIKRRDSRRNAAGLTEREQHKQDKIKAIKELKEQGLSQNEIAKEVGITQQYVSKILSI